MQEQFLEHLCSNSDSFEIMVGMHQGLALRPLLFVTVMEAISREYKAVLPWAGLAIFGR